MRRSDERVEQRFSNLQAIGSLAVAQVNDWIDRLAGINPLYEPERVAVLDDRDPEHTRIPQGRRRGDSRLVQIEI
jgi:hypothetical protein